MMKTTGAQLESAEATQAQQQEKVDEADKQYETAKDDTQGKKDIYDTKETEVKARYEQEKEDEKKNIFMA